MNDKKDDIDIMLLLLAALNILIQIIRLIHMY